ncbi:MAG: manganese-dependent inorganic pyrophosphatase [Candidatus Falkowbacteria bacterium]
MSDKIYVIGHKSPDLDSVAAAINYAGFLNFALKTDNYVPARAGEINKVTAFVLDKFGFKAPELLEDAAGKKLILVDHNEASQSVDGREKAKVVAILDHHKMNFSYDEPIYLDVRPWGSSNSIIYSLSKIAGYKIDEKTAGLMLSAILDDTVITKSPTCTEKDKGIIVELAPLAGIDDWREYGLEMFKVKAGVGDMTAEGIIRNDFKDFEFKAGKFGFGQIETVDLSEFDGRKEELLAALEDIKTKNGYQGVILFITDIMKEGSLFLVAADNTEEVEKALGAKLENNQVYIPGIMSRKKQVVPKFTEVFDK